MFEFAALTYGVLASVILSAAQRNRKLARPHPPLLLYVGYLLCGVSAGLAMIEADTLNQVKGAMMIDIVAPEYREAFAGLHKHLMNG